MYRNFIQQRKYINIILHSFFIITVFFIFPGFSQELSFSDSVKVDSTIDTTAISSLQDSIKLVQQKPAVIDSAAILHPGMELLAINRKKTKFVYFDTTQSIDRVIENNAFDIGEKLTFIIRYGLIVAGSATMSIPEIVKVKGYECYHIITNARSSKFFSVFFKVNDRVESFMDKDGLFSWRFEKHLREGKYKADQYVDFDHVKRIVVTNKKDTLRIPPCVQDVLTTFYYVRTLPLEVGKSVFIDNQADRKLYPLEIKIHGKERITVRAGTFDCVVIEPMLRSDSIFKQQGRLTVWLTDDSRRIPVQMKSKVLIGSITAELKEMKGVLPANEHVELQRN